MAEVGERAELVLEAQQRGGVLAPEELQGDGAGPLAIERLVDDAVAAGAEPAPHAEAVVAREVAVRSFHERPRVYRVDASTHSGDTPAGAGSSASQSDAGIAHSPEAGTTSTPPGDTNVSGFCPA